MGVGVRDRVRTLVVPKYYYGREGKGGKGRVEKCGPPSHQNPLTPLLETVSIATAKTGRMDITDPILFGHG